MPLGPGYSLHGKYRLVRLLGDGGMGAVYEATHERLGTRVAIKVLHSEIASRPGIVERFLQEARVSAQIRSAHVAQVIDVDRTPEGEAYMVMELLEGETLLALLDRERKLSVAVASAFTMQILEALDAAHELGVVHRDLKPENVFVTHGTQKTVVKLIDFGIAKVRREGEASLTLAGVTMGTAEYMAPEQAFSADRADARSDLYAVGVMFYEMLSGTRPVTGDDPRVIAMKVERGEVKPLVHALPSVPPPIAGLAHRAMAARPEMRFQSASEMRAALDRLVSHDAGGTLPLPLGSPTRSSVPVMSEREREPADGPLTAPSTLRGTPVDHAAYGPPPMLDPPLTDPPSTPPRSSALPLLGLAILLGVGAVVALAVVQQSHASTAQAPSASSSTPAVGSLAPLSMSAASSATAIASDDHTATALRPLGKTPQGGRVIAKSDAGALSSAHPNPTASGFTLPLPNGSSLTLPTAIPTEITLPGFGP